MRTIRMRHVHDPVCRALVLGASGFMLAGSAALAAGAYDPAGSQARYASERGDCSQSHQDRATCLREAAAAREAARRGQLDNGAADYRRNATARCEPLPADQRSDCLARMQGQGNTSGSVEEGGIYREKVTREIGARPPAEAAPPPADPVIAPRPPTP